MKKKIVHYGVKFIVDIACGANSYYQQICPHCKSVIESHFLEATFSKKKVTCKRCRKTKAFKDLRKLIKEVKNANNNM